MNNLIVSQQFASNLTEEEISKAFSKALSEKSLVGPEDAALMFYDLSFLERRIRQMQDLFPSDTLHAIALKANPLVNMLAKTKALGAGVEVASFPELFLAEKAGFAPSAIVFDSPCKTRQEIEYALQAGISLNADSFDELDRIAELMNNISSESIIGLRVNPQAGTGSISSTSVGGVFSKFGIPLNDQRERILEYYLKYDWLQGIHLHTGSQGCPLPLLVEGIRRVMNLAEEVNESLLLNERQNRITTFDMGGGLPVSYQTGETVPTMEQYLQALRSACPGLFSGNFKLVTEFGRYIYANAGWVASKVEYVKKERDHHIVMTHVGADLFLRKCYNPADWHHRISVVDKDGNLKTGTAKCKYTVAGPLCFAGDILASGIELPMVEEGDYLLIHDAGAYTFGMWSRYNSRQMPAVLGYTTEDYSFETLKQRESRESLLDFWT